MNCYLIGHIFKVRKGEAFIGNLQQAHKAGIVKEVTESEKLRPCLQVSHFEIVKATASHHDAQDTRSPSS